MNNSLYKQPNGYLVHTFKTRKEWLDRRIKGLGGSDAGAVIGRSQYKTNQEVWKIKVFGQGEDTPDTDAMKYGRDAEKHIRELFKLGNLDKYEVQYMNNVILQSIEHPFLLYSPDGLLIDKITGQRGIYEGKTGTVFPGNKDKWDDRIPDNYFAQCLHGLLVTKMDFVVLVYELKKFDIKTEKVYYERRDVRLNRSDFEEDIEVLYKSEEEFWAYVLRKEQPPLLLTM